MGIATATVIRRFGKGLRVDIHNCRSNLFSNSDELVGRDRGVHNLERRGVGAVVLFFLSAYAVSGKGTSHNGG